MKIVLYILLFISLTSNAQTIDSLKYKLRNIDLVESNKKREKQIRNEIEKKILINRRIDVDTLNMDYGLFVDKKGEIFVTYNEINDVIASNTFENIFKKTYFVIPFKDSLKTKVISYKFKGINRYIKDDSIYNAYIPKKNLLCKIDIKNGKSPRYKGCGKKLSNKGLKICMSKKITKLIAKNFNVNLAHNLNLPLGRKRIFIRFVINKEGKVIKIHARGPHPKLEQEAIRVIKLIPKMKQPGTMDGKSVNVRYNLPIIFNIEP